MKNETTKILIADLFLLIWLFVVMFISTPNKIKFFFFTEQQKVEWRMAVDKLEKINLNDIKRR